MAIMKKVIAFLLVVGFLAGAAQARTPEPGDYVRVSGVMTSASFSYEGVITDIKDGLICLNCSRMSAIYSSDSHDVDREYPLDVCIGSGTIISLVWLVD